ncbi:MAG: VOC family protein [Phycisphaeraceae bacterium]
MINARLARLILWVEDPHGLSDWYCETFGWTETVRAVDEGWIELDAGGFTLALHGGTTLKPRRWPKLQVAVDDVAAQRTRLLRAGIRMSKIHKWQHLEWSECSDPEGNTVQICNR